MQLVIHNLIDEFEAIQREITEASGRSDEVCRRLRVAVRLAASDLSQEQRREAYIASVGGSMPDEMKYRRDESCRPLIIEESGVEYSGRKKFTRMKSMTATFRDRALAYYHANRHLRQKDLCAHLGISVPTLRKILNGDYDGLGQPEAPIHQQST